MFQEPDTVITRQLDVLSATRSDHAIAVTQIRDAILNGVGYRSLTHVIATPSPQLFRRYFPHMDERTFQTIFNRYAHISLTARPRPYVPRADAIRLPITPMSRFAATPRVLDAGNE
jgi:hypothetical protein